MEDFPEIFMREYLPLFVKECFNRGDEIDPKDEQDWYSLTLGWAIAKGMDPETALDFATYVRYRTPYA